MGADINRDLIRWEIKKLWSQPMILVFLLLCIVFQILLAARDRYLEPDGDYAVYVAWMTREAGRRMGEEFTERVLKSKNAREETQGQSDLNLIGQSLGGQARRISFRITAAKGWRTDCFGSFISSAGRRG